MRLHLYKKERNEIFYCQGDVTYASGREVLGEADVNSELSWRR
jgi:hypothetical protein